MDTLWKDPVTSLVGAVALPLNLAVYFGKITNEQATSVIHVVNMVAPMLLLWAKDRKKA